VTSWVTSLTERETMTNKEDVQIATPEERSSVIDAYARGYIALSDTTTEPPEFVQIICAELQALRAEVVAVQKHLAHLPPRCRRQVSSGGLARTFHMLGPR